MRSDRFGMLSKGSLMMDHNTHQQFVDRLLEQETRVSDSQLDKYRRNLQQKIAKAGRRERRMRAVTLGMAVIVLLGYGFFIIERLISPASNSALPHLQHVLDLLPDMVGAIIFAVLFACYLTCAICVVPFLLLYFLQYRRKVQQTQQEQILAILGELQRQITELRERTPPNGS
jgi:hypothetical protein